MNLREDLSRWIHNYTLGWKWKVQHWEATWSFPKYLFAVLISIISLRIKTFFLIFPFQQWGQHLSLQKKKKKMPLALPQSKAAVVPCQRQSLCRETARRMPCTLTGPETDCFVSFFLDALFRGPLMRAKGRRADYLLYLHDQENGPLYFPFYCFLSFFDAFALQT